jgi:N-alpha-acetyl-L-2,4-diaminobutyrate deacetylase
MIPMMNYPAFMAGKRTSPIDGGNMNRVFPGAPDGTITQKIADYFQRTLLPLADVVLDFHSGGKTLDFVPFAAAHVLGDVDQQARCVAAMQAFNAPYSMILKEIDSVGMYDTAAEDMGKVFISTELGGGGCVTARTVKIANRGIANFLKHFGILAGELDTQPTIQVDTTGEGCFITSESRGLFEMSIDLGGSVQEGDVVARVHNIYRTGGTPDEYRAQTSGIMAGRHFPGLVDMGDFLCVIGAIS